MNHRLEQLNAFLRWAAGPLLETRNREAYAEWLVIQALGLEPGPYRRAGAELELPQGVHLAVRSAADLQGPKPATSGAISFAIQQRLAPVFVFCLLTAPDPTTADPQDPRQWLFWVVPTRTLHPERQTIGLQALFRAHGEGISHGELATRIQAVLRPEL